MTISRWCRKKPIRRPPITRRAPMWVSTGDVEFSAGGGASEPRSGRPRRSAATAFPGSSCSKKGRNRKPRRMFTTPGGLWRHWERQSSAPNRIAVSERDRLDPLVPAYQNPGACIHNCLCVQAMFAVKRWNVAGLAEFLHAECLQRLLAHAAEPRERRRVAVAYRHQRCVLCKIGEKTANPRIRALRQPVMVQAVRGGHDQQAGA